MKSIVFVFFLFSSFLLLLRPVNIALVKQQIEQYQLSGEYLQEVDKVIGNAHAFLQKVIARNNKKDHPAKLALVLDIDETSLTNFSKIKARGFCNIRNAIHQEILAADSPALKPTLNLYNYALKNDVKVFFVTGRDTSEKEATIKNLRMAGYQKWSGIFFKPVNYHSASIIPFKSSARKKITEMGYTIVESIGDQYSDIRGGYTKCGFKLPNPFYFIA